MIFSIFRFFCTLRFQIYKYCPIITNHTSMESYLFSFQMLHKVQKCTLKTGFVVQGHTCCDCSCFLTRLCVVIASDRFSEGNVSLNLLQCSVGRSYMCGAEQTLSIVPSFSINTFRLQLQPFNVTADRFSAGTDRRSRSESNTGFILTSQYLCRSKKTAFIVLYCSLSST